MSDSFSFTQPRGRSTIGLTPLIDVVFILLLFFMLATSFKREGAIELQVPEEGQSQTSLRDGLRLRILNTGGVLVDDKQVENSSLVRALAALYKVSGNRPMSIQVESEVNVQTLVSILDLIRESGFENLSVTNK